MERALILNASYEPHSIVRDRDVVGLYLDGLVEPLEYTGREFRSPSITVQVPSVARLVRYIVMPEAHRSVLLTTRAVLARDEYTCGYCGLTGLTGGQGGNGTLDHVVPRAKGGPHSWLNSVSCCRRCNQKKRDLLLDDLGWELKITPYRPKGVSAWLLSKEPSPEWVPYLQSV
jgi:5-methylcytosine-specific restriction endonuclease McrA